MSTAAEIVSAFSQLSREEQDRVLDQLAEIWEDSLELSDEFRTKLARAEEDIAEGRVRIRQPGK